VKAITKGVFASEFNGLAPFGLTDDESSLVDSQISEISTQ